MGIYHFAITEVEGDIASVKYDKHVANVTVTVVDNNEGALVATASVTGEMTFTNEYSTQGTVAIEVTKAFTGRTGNTWLASDSFSFHLAVDASDAQTVAAVKAKDVVLPTVTEISITNGHEGYKNAFADITINKAGTYKFIIHEHQGNIPGVTYDTDERSVTVTAADDGDGTMTVTYTVEDGKTLTFSNVYNRQPVTLSGAANLVVEKDFTGRANNEWRDGDKFTFVLAAKDDATEAAVNAGKITLPETTLVIDKNNQPKAYFGDIRFTEPGEYVFTVTEQASGIAGVTDDAKAERTIYVSVVDNNDGTMSVTKKAESDSLVYKNVYDATPVVLIGETNLDVTKTLTGREWFQEDVFEFTLEAVNGTVEAVENEVVLLPEELTISISGKDEAKKAHFGNITFNEVGVYEFQIKETKGDIASVQYDSHVAKVIVTVTDNHEGALVADAEVQGSKEFVNQYSTKGTVAIEVEKDFTGRVNNAWLTSDAFQFELAVDDADEATVKAAEDGIVVLPENKQVEITRDTGDYRDAFEAITINKAGTYKFVVNEIKGNIAGVTYDEDVRNVTVRAVDNGDGTISTSYVVENEESLTFENQYNRQPVTLIGETNLAVEKDFTGRANNQWLEDDKFMFKLEGANDLTIDAIAKGTVNLPTELVLEVTAQNKDNAYFGDIVFTEIGEYSFKVTELLPEGASPNAEGSVIYEGIKYDTTTKNVTVVVTDNNDGTMSVTKTEASDELVFENEYSTEPANLVGATDLVVTKAFTGRANDKWLETDTFTFVLAAKDDATKNAVDAGNIKLPATTLEINQKNQPTANFGDIEFKATGTYTFTVTEVLPEGKAVHEGIKYDTTTKDVTVVVTDMNNGKLQVVKVTEKSDDLTFTNEYSREDAVLSGIQVTKKLTGREWFNSDEFAFTLTAVGKTADVVGTDVILPEDATGIKAKKGAETVAFGDIVFKQPGVYTFEVKETKGEISNIKYSEDVVEVTITVTDNNKGQLEAVISNTEGSMTFENIYTPTPVTATVQGTKVLTGRDLNEEEFSFQIVKDASSPEDTPMPAQTTVKNNGEGVVAFAPMTYTKAGTYKYLITEVAGNVPGVTYDGGTVEATVVVTYNAETGILTPAVSYEKVGGTGTGFVFNNVYTTNPKGLIVEGTKKVTVSTGNTYTMAGGEFTFVVTPVTSPALAGDPIKEAYSVTNEKDGKITIIDATYTEPGTYIYSVREADGDVGGITEDSTVYTVTVDVKDNLKGELIITNSISVDSEPLDAVVFDNVYDPGQTSVSLFGRKDLETEHDIVLEAGLFKFNVTAVSGIEVVEGVETQIAKENVPMPAEKQVTHDATGVFQFGEITYLKPGTYVYEISEDAANKVPGYSYSDAKYQVTVKVTDVNGSLQAEVTGLGEATDPTVVFTNGYVPTPVTLEGNTALKGTKTLTGRDLKAGEFEFTLTATDSKAPMPTRTTVANAANGGFTFEPITFRKAGTYYYTIAEKNDGLGGVTYDSTVYTVKVVVTDKGGYLDAEVTYSAPKAGTQEQETKASAAFTNTYKAEPAHLVLRAEKTLTGRDLTAGEFTFLLKNGDGEVVSETTNAADGTITFKELQFAEVGTFEYTVVEDSSAQAEGIVYDNVEYKVTVKVTDDLEGNLVAAVVDQEELLFSNQYTEPAVTAIKMQALNDGEATAKTLTAKAGDTVTYTIKLENSGDAVAKNIVLTDKVPEGLKLITGTAKGGDTVDVAEDGTITWNISKLEVGKSTEVSFQVRVPLVAEDTTWLNVATYVYSNNPNNPEDPEEPFTPEKTNEVEVIEKVPNLVAVKKQQVNMGDITDEKVTVNVGDKVTYYITLTNTGNGVADNITLTDVVPEGLEFIEGTVRGGDANDVAEDGTITWNIAQLESGKSIEVSFQVRVPLVEKDTTWKNVATVVYENNPQNLDYPEEPGNPDIPENPKTPIVSNEVVIQEEVVVTPGTGDTTASAMWITIAMTAAFAVVATTTYRKRKVD